MANIVGVRFKKAGKVYYFEAGDLELDVNDTVVVKTSRGTELGQVVIAPGQVDNNETEENLSPVLRKAEPEDLAQAEELETKASEALIECGKMIEELQQRAILVGFNRNERFVEIEIDESMNELSELTLAAGAEVLGMIVQNKDKISKNDGKNKYQNIL